MFFFCLFVFKMDIFIYYSYILFAARNGGSTHSELFDAELDNTR